ncbi:MULTISPECIES: pseudouridine synthase [unclassified Granulicatella]|uniref:pseudouridine synthase n=1 Tax=unclassified Granulicatella TaxID=2630493 RepID=UPI001073CAC7|nr:MULTISPECIES: pseudouridine synthase [unclassified Granulicatella]MBF0780571.1 rRNA pseudouridine synthase [Granulicatella sp. 19428wC4_WM01]TFU94922.1 rRNA pseudouridine synthase [Granulicatella sp. WM01]
MERLQKVMAHAGVASRRKCEELIVNGKVYVNGICIRELGAKVSPNDKIEVNGVPLYKETLVYYLFHKPAGVISAVSDDKNRRVVVDYFPHVSERIYPVGRLDYDTTGLLLLTNDGELAQLLMHPKYHVDKTYVAKVKGIPNDKQIKQLRYGVKIDGKMTSPAKVTVLSTDYDKGTSRIELTIHEGWNHQVKKMLMGVGLPVMKLKRERFGFLTLENLAAGQWRALKKNEVSKLRQEALRK